VPNITVAFQGVSGAYSELAAADYFGKRVKTKPHVKFADVFRAVKAGRVTYGIIPIENSLAGSVHQNYDHCLEHRVWIIGEKKFRVSHSLIVNRGTKLGDIRRVYSHPQALAQCSTFIGKLKKAEAVSYFDTAASAKYVAEAGFKDAAAIASAQAAKHYGMQVLRSRVENKAENFTRFLILAKKPQYPKTSAGSKSSIVFALKNVPGALHKALSVFAIREIDLLKIESRPIPGSPWKYLFYLDFSGSLRDERCVLALEHLGEITTFIKILGSYRAG